MLTKTGHQLREQVAQLHATLVQGHKQGLHDLGAQVDAQGAFGRGWDQAVLYERLRVAQEALAMLLETLKRAN